MLGLLQLFVGSRHIGAVWQIKVLGILVSEWKLKFLERETEKLANN